MTDHHTAGEKLARACECVLDGGVIAYPTESCFGLGCNPQNENAIERILRIKQRDAAQGLILVGADSSQFDPYLQWQALSDTQRQQLEASWPGPVSWLIPAQASCSGLLRGKHSTLAVRVSAYQPVQALCRLAQMPLVSTSANRHGQAAYINAEAVATQMCAEIDYIIDLPVQGLSSPSRIIDAVTHKTLRP